MSREERTHRVHGAIAPIARRDLLSAQCAARVPIRHHMHAAMHVRAMHVHVMHVRATLPA